MILDGNSAYFNIKLDANWSPSSFSWQFDGRIMSPSLVWEKALNPMYSSDSGKLILDNAQLRKAADSIRRNQSGNMTSVSYIRQQLNACFPMISSDSGSTITSGEYCMQSVKAHISIILTVDGQLISLRYE